MFNDPNAIRAWAEPMVLMAFALLGLLWTPTLVIANWPKRRYVQLLTGFLTIAAALGAFGCLFGSAKEWLR